MASKHAEPLGDFTTRVLTVNATQLRFNPPRDTPSFAESSSLSFADPQTETQKHMERAAHELHFNDIPVAFPTETVYGLGADATRSAAVRNIFAAKGRPMDNPLIVHVHSINQLRSMLKVPAVDTTTNAHQTCEDPIPAIYRPLIKRYWPGPLTIILPNPKESPLAKEVTAGLSTFGARMPSHPVALALLKASNKPLAAPSANSSSKPSPTTAAHVLHDLDGKIETIVDGGACDVGVESTVVDGLSDPPSILRPGGISLDMLKRVQGWEKTTVAYQDQAGDKNDQPRAPGMKYKHYSPKARVLLYEAGTMPPYLKEFASQTEGYASFGVIRTATWPMLSNPELRTERQGTFSALVDSIRCVSNQNSADTSNPVPMEEFKVRNAENRLVSMFDINLGRHAEDIAKGLFAALRLLDLKGVDVIIVEGIDVRSGDAAAAVMNRLRKAAEIKGKHGL